MWKWLTKFKKKKQRDPSAAELELITTTLIEETSAKLRKRFQTEMQNEIAKGNQIELDFAERTLEMLVREAIANRKKLIGRIEKDIETGDLFDRYYGKMRAINAMTNKAYALMQRMDVAEKQYNYLSIVYKNVTGKIYIKDVKPDETDFKRSNKDKNKDILEAIDARKVYIGGEDIGDA